MQRLLYISTSRGPITQATIDDILRVSRRNNAADAITGLLVAGGTRFLQVLEGSDLAVSRTFERIQRDPRHLAMVQLARQTITQRSFGNWAMGYAQGGGLRPDAATASSAATIAALIAPIEDPVLRGYFTGFADVHLAPA